MRVTKEERDNKLIELGNSVEVNRNYKKEDSDDVLLFLKGDKNYGKEKSKKES